MSYIPLLAVSIFTAYTLWLQRRLAAMHRQFKADNAEFLRKFEELSKEDEP